MNATIDNIDRKIISLLQKNPNISQNEIAKEVELSQPSVSARIKRMRENGILASMFGIDIKKVGLHVAKIEINKNEKNEFIKDCPYILSVIETVEKNILYIVSEDFSSLEAIAKKHFDMDDFEVVLSSYPNLVFPIKIPEKNNGCSNCDCSNCDFYIKGKCIGCPSSLYYRGKLW
ncbi:MAG: winged helix-turn-helix transcriptional regulator [Thermoplasmatales archaeon]|nr:winged helix-turn-helix transcriptional regulator [Thermoplasmatales archaeon]